MIRKSGVVNRVVDLRLDTIARQAALAVREAGNGGATERFLNRFLDHLHTVDSEGYASLAPLAPLDGIGSRRKRRRPG